MPRAEIEGEMGDSHVGLQARLMCQALRKLSGAIKQSNTALVFTNQLREKIGVMFGNPETTTADARSSSTPRCAWTSAACRRSSQWREVVGNRTRVRVTKNKVAPPFREAEFDIMFNEGISKDGDILDIGANMDIIDKRGAFFRTGTEVRPGPRERQRFPARSS